MAEKGSAGKPTAGDGGTHLRLLLFISLVALALSVRAAPAGAGHVCAKYEAIAADLRQVYDERPIASGISRAGKAYMELWASESGTWTILVVFPNGLSCVTNSGRDFDLVRTSIKRPPES